MALNRKTLYDSNSALNVLGCLMRNPLLCQDAAYPLQPNDFANNIHKLIFSSIFNLAANGYATISPSDIDMDLSQYDAQYESYKRNHGFELLQQCEKLFDENVKDVTPQFKLYYARVKKFSVIRDLEIAGIDTSIVYDPEKDILNHDVEDEKLNKYTIQQIIDTFRDRMAIIEDRHVSKVSSSCQYAYEGIEELIQQFEEKPEIGLSLDGDIVNYALSGARLGKMYLYSAPSGQGKALPNSTIIPMFNGGEKTVGEVRVGDVLIDRLGKPTKVLAIYPQGKRKVYKITFKDGRTALCNDEHLWTYHNNNSRDKYKLETNTLKEIMNIASEKGGFSGPDGFGFGVPFNQSVEYGHKDLKLHPYVLGLLLGDGCFREQPTNRNLTFSTKSVELLDSFTTYCGCTYKRHSLSNYTYSFKEQGQNVHVYEFCKQHNIEELYNKKTEDKAIPSDYLYGDIEQRFDLLNGLLDTDGSVDPKGRVVFTTINKTLALQVQQLCRSLGFIITIREDRRENKYPTGVCYNLNILGSPELKKRLFRLSYKKERILNWYNNGKRKESYLYNAIVSVEDMGYEEEMTCFYVDNEEHLFLMNDYIVTHNTRHMVGDACALSLPYLDKNGNVVWRGNPDGSMYQKVLFVATEQKADEIQTLILAYMSGVNERKITHNECSIEEKERLKKAVQLLKRFKENFMIECIPDPSIETVKAKITKYIVQGGFRYIFYDYIFTSPSLVTEFAGAHIREDVALMMLSNTLKEIAMNYDVFIESGTQLNENWSKNIVGLRDQNCIRGSKAICDKADIGMIGIRLQDEERERIDVIWNELKKTFPDRYGAIEPNMVIDIYKNRRGEMVGVKIFRYFDYATCHCTDLFVTDSSYKAVAEVRTENKNVEIYDFLTLKTIGALKEIN